MDIPIRSRNKVVIWSPPPERRRANWRAWAVILYGAAAIVGLIVLLIKGG